MKSLKRLVATILALVLTFSLFACSSSESASLGESGDDGSAIVMKYGDYTLSEKEYSYILSKAKTMWVSQYQSYLYQYTGTVYDESEILEMPVDAEGKTTLADFIKDYAIEFSQNMLILEHLCGEADIKISNEEDVADISGYIADIEYAYGGTDLFEIRLAKLGFTRSAIQRYEEFYKNLELYSDYRYGENGIAKVPTSTVHEYFLENYISYDGCAYSYIDSDSEAILYEFTDEEVHDYFYDNFVKIRHVLYKTVDSSNNKLSDAKIAEKKAEAESALAAIKSGEKTIYDFEDANDDNGDEYTFTYRQMVKAFEKAAFEMEVGETRVVETEYGFHLMQKLDITDEDLYGSDANDKDSSEDSDVSNDESAVDESDVSEAETSDNTSDTSSDKKEDTKKPESKGMKDEVIAAMSKDKIRAEAVATLEKLKSGELKGYPEKDSSVEYYDVMESGFIDKTSTETAAFAAIISKLDLDAYSISDDISRNAVYLLRKRSFTEKDITSAIYTKIEDGLKMEVYEEFIQSYADKVQIDNEALNKFDVKAVAMLEDEFYAE